MTPEKQIENFKTLYGFDRGLELIEDTKKILNGSPKDLKEVQEKIESEDPFADVKSTLDEDSDNWDEHFQSGGGH